MKLKFNNRYDTIAAYSLIVILFTVFCVFIGYYFSDIIGGIGFVIQIFKPIIYGLIMAFLFLPMLRLFEERLFAFTEKKKPHPKIRSVLALTMTYLIVAAVVTLFAMIIIPQAVTSYKDLEMKLSGYVAAAQNWITNTLNDLPAINIVFSSPSAQILKPVFVINADGSIPNVIVSRINGSHNREMVSIIRSSMSGALYYNAADIINEFIANSYNFFSDLTPYIFAAVMKIVTETKNLVLGLIISVYYLSARKAITARLLLISETLLPRKLNDMLLELTTLVNQSFMQFVNGKIIDAAILGFLCFIFMSIFRMPYAPLISLLVGVTNVIPYIGPFIGATPGAFIIFVSDPPMAFWFILLIIALQQIDFYFIEPHIMQSQIKLDSVWIMISVVMMGGLLGLVGMFIGVPVFAIIYVLIKRSAEQMLIKKGLSPETSAWLSHDPDY
ncbi:MAG: AI-2E family transporter [Eubacteriales bacterium]